MSPPVPSLHAVTGNRVSHHPAHALPRAPCCGRCAPGPASRSCSNRSPLSRPEGFPTDRARSFLGLLLPLQGLSSAAAPDTASSAWTPWVGRAPRCPSLRMALLGRCDPPAPLPSLPEGGEAGAGSVRRGVTRLLAGAVRHPKMPSRGLACGCPRRPSWGSARQRARYRNAPEEAG